MPTHRSLHGSQQLLRGYLLKDEANVPEVAALSGSHIFPSMARLPESIYAFIDPAKVRDYLLSPSHPVGRSKSFVFGSLGYTRDDWVLLRDDLLRHARVGEARLVDTGAFGRKWLVSGSLQGPNGRHGRFVSVWLIESNASPPRFITAYPE